MLLTSQGVLTPVCGGAVRRVPAEVRRAALVEWALQVLPPRCWSLRHPQILLL